MQKRVITDKMLGEYELYLADEEKSPATLGKYRRDVQAFRQFCAGAPVTKKLVMQYKQVCVERGYKAASVNSMLAAVNSFLTFAHWEDCKVKKLRIQHRAYCAEEKELSKGEYMRLLEAAGQDECTSLILQTICGTGIRVSELNAFTVEAIYAGEIVISCKSKTRTILLPKQLRKMLLRYAGRKNIRSGPLFVGRSGKPIHRSCVWRLMKNLCRKAGVGTAKVFPHNLRKLFARTFYAAGKDIAKLADVLGHSNIDTTRIYIITSGMEHRQQIDSLGLVIDNKGSGIFPGDPTPDCCAGT